MCLLTLTNVIIVLIIRYGAPFLSAFTPWLFALMVVFSAAAISFIYMLTFLFATVNGIVKLVIGTSMISVLTSLATLFIVSLLTGQSYIDCMQRIGLHSGSSRSHDISHQPPGRRHHQTDCSYHASQLISDIPDFLYPYEFIASCLIISIFVFNSKKVWEQIGFGKFVNHKIVLVIIYTMMIWVIMLLLEFFNVQRECKCCSCTNSKNQTGQRALSILDTDVLAEQQRVMSGSTGTDVVLAKGLTKRFPDSVVPAVNGITFGLRKGECFGLLGNLNFRWSSIILIWQISLNGAGKSTTFEMLTGAVKPSGGVATINGIETGCRGKALFRQFNYCPQTNIHFPNLTVTCNLSYFATISGIEISKLNEVVSFLVDQVGLVEFTNTKATNLSGGNQRKLQIAISLLSNRNVIFLDEPTTGLDPGSRRKIWNLIRVLTKMGMDECEALCDRLVIMVSGQFRCIGSVQYLKHKFGNEYRNQLKLESKDLTVDESKLKVDGVVKFLTGKVPTLEVGEIVGATVSLKMPMGRIQLSQLFAFLLEAKEKYQIETFSVGQVSLEHIFVSMAKVQSDQQIQQQYPQPIQGQAGSTNQPLVSRSKDLRQLPPDNSTAPVFPGCLPLSEQTAEALNKLNNAHSPPIPVKVISETKSVGSNEKSKSSTKKQDPSTKSDNGN